MTDSGSGVTGLGSRVTDSGSGVTGLGSRLTDSGSGVTGKHGHRKDRLGVQGFRC